MLPLLSNLSLLNIPFLHLEQITYLWLVIIQHLQLTPIMSVPAWFPGCKIYWKDLMQLHTLLGIRIIYKYTHMHILHFH